MKCYNQNVRALAVVFIRGYFFYDIYLANNLSRRIAEGGATVANAPTPIKSYP